MPAITMLCPFTKEVCTECAIFRGRHWYLCFCKEYRGYTGKPKRTARQYKRIRGKHQKV